MTARDELVRAIGEAVFAEVKKFPPPAYLPGAIVPMGASVEDVGRAALAVVDEELAVLRAKLALSPEQVEAMEQEIAELKQEHGVLSGQLHEIREAVRKYFAGPEEPAWCGEDATNKDADDGAKAMERIRAVLDGALPPAPQVFFPGDTVPRGVATVVPPSPDEDRSYPYVMPEAPWSYVVRPDQPEVELRLPSVEDVRAAIERARAEREEAQL